MASLESNMQLLSDLHKIDEDVLKASYERTADILAAQDRHSLAQENRAHRHTDYLTNAIHMVGDNNLTATERNGSANLAATSALASQGERLQNENLIAHKDTYRHLSEMVHHYGENAGRDFGKLVRDIYRVEQKVESSTCELKLQAQENTCKLELQAANNFSAIQLEAMRNRNDLMQKISDCCCEMKERMAISEANVKDLIKAVDAERVRDALKAAETRNLVLELSRYGHHGHHGNGNGQ